MKHKNISFCPKGTLSDLKAFLAELADSETSSCLIFLADGSKWDTHELEQILKGSKIKIAGGLFPQIISESMTSETGFVAAGFDEEIQIVLAQGLDIPEISIDEYFKQMSSKFMECCSFMVLVDSMSPRIPAFLSGIYNSIGADKTYWGGGTGSLSFTSKPSIFTNEGFFSNAGLLVGFMNRASLGIGHGWKKAAGPFVVTSSSDNVIHTLNFQPAAETYRSHVKALDDLAFDQKNFFDSAKSNPLGIERLDGSVLVRDPILEIGTSLVCVGQVKENSVVYFLKSTPSYLIREAQCSAHRIAKENSPGSSIFVFDCISRALVLEGDFSKEIQAISNEFPSSACLIGALSLGEISSEGKSILEFHNKTCLVARMEKSAC